MAVKIRPVKLRSQSGNSSRISMLLELAKSGIVALVLISVLGGYLVGHPLEAPFDSLRLVETLLGILLLASGSSALNQLQETSIDQLMPRTAKRPLVSGRLTRRNAVILILSSLSAGLAILFHLDFHLGIMGVAAVISYNGLYTLWWKPRWPFAAVPGAIPGALPIWMGYVAASGKVGAPGGIYLFFLLFFWQMPHFWVLALKYREDYARGMIPTLPVAHGEPLTVRQIAVWALAYVGIGLLGPLFLGLSPLALIAEVLTGIWILKELATFTRLDRPWESKAWLRFFLAVNFSLIVYIGVAAIDLWSVYVRSWLI